MTEGAVEGGDARLIVEQFVVQPFAENSLLIGCVRTRQGVLIDPGGRVPELLAAADRHALSIEAIWLTHAHIDHVMGVAEAARATSAPILLHPDDRAWYEGAEQQGAMFGMAFELPPPVDRWLSDGETLALGELTAEVIHVPGHSEGHVAFWFRDLATVFSGDCLFAGSIGRTDLPGGSYETLMSSIRGRLLPLGDGARVVPGHGPSTTIGEEVRTNPFLIKR